VSNASGNRPLPLKGVYTVHAIQAGDLQLWGLEERGLLDSLPCADPLLALAAVPRAPYLCLGCESGALQFVQLNGGRGEPAEGVCEARSLEMLPYERKASQSRNLLAFLASNGRIARETGGTGIQGGVLREGGRWGARAGNRRAMQPSLARRGGRRPGDQRGEDLS